MKPLIIILLGLLPLHIMSAYERAFPRTAVDTIEVKTLPASRLLASHSDGNYFQSNNGLFMPLFRYIQSNDIAMTTPVEAEIEPGIMYFYVGSDYADADLEGTDDVSIIELPERTVLSIGVRGSYNAENFARAKAALLTHLAGQNTWSATGSARAIYWNGPYTPSLLKRSEIHLPVAKSTSETE
ncbi:heme-binding protein [Opitutales bacterium]|nr:heme-binding protein [Opitutales bacterium]MDB2681541.1 heme-binding protein [Opitutales bacterium]